MGAAQQLLLAAGAGGSSAPVPTFSNVSLLIHGSARPFIDASLNKYPVANYFGIAALDTSVINFQSSASATLKIPTTSAFLFGTGAWALTAKVYCDTNGTRIFDTRTSFTSPTDGFAFAIQGSTFYPFVQVNGTTYGVGTPAGNLAIASNTLTDVAISYDGTVLRCFVNGALSWTQTVSLNISAQGSLLTIGNVSNSTLGNTTTAKMSELMIVKGEAVYTAAYTPQSVRSDTGIVLEAGAAVTFANVKLLLHGAGTNGSTTFTDSSTSARTPTVNGNAQISTAQHRIGSSSMSFDGNGDYLSYSNSADFNFGTGDYCSEFQCYMNSAAASQYFAGNYQGSSAGWTHSIESGTGRMTFNETGDGADIRTQDSAYTTSTWRHSAMGRKSSLLMAWVEGELVDLVADTQNVTSSAAFIVGRLASFAGTYVNGYVQEMRIIKGECPYARSFIVQTAAHPDS